MATKPKKSPPKKSQGEQAGSATGQPAQRTQAETDSSGAAGPGPAQSREQGMASNQSQGEQPQGPQQGQQPQGQQGEQQSGEQQSSGEGSDVTNVVDLDLQPLRLDLLGLVVKTEEIHVMIDAESGEGKLVGNLVGQLSTLLDSIDLSAMTGQITETAQNTVKGLAGEASDQVQQQGSQLIGSAVQSLSGYLQRKMPGAVGGQGQSQSESAASGGE